MALKKYKKKSCLKLFPKKKKKRYIFNVKIKVSKKKNSDTPVFLTHQSTTITTHVVKVRGFMEKSCGRNNNFFSISSCNNIILSHIQPQDLLFSRLFFNYDRTQKYFLLLVTDFSNVLNIYIYIYINRKLHGNLKDVRGIGDPKEKILLGAIVIKKKRENNRSWGRVSLNIIQTGL